MDDRRTKPESMTDHDLLIRIDTRLDSMHGESVRRFDGIDVKIADHEQRLRALNQQADEQRGSVRTWKVVTSLAMGLLMAALAYFGIHAGIH